MERPSNPFVFTKKTVFMQRISDAVSKGSIRYIQGTVPVSKAGVFASKMTQRYDCDLTMMQAVRNVKRVMQLQSYTSGIRLKVISIYTGFCF
jgi:hypothetical protein